MAKARDNAYVGLHRADFADDPEPLYRCDYCKSLFKIADTRVFDNKCYCKMCNAHLNEYRS